MNDEKTELLKILDRLKTTLYQTRHYINTKLTEQINQIENIKNKIILETWMEKEK